MTSMALVRMASTEACARTMRRLGLADVLRAVALAADSKEPAPNLQPWAQLSVMESRHLAGAFVPACERGECRVCMRVLLRWARRHAACEWALRVRGLVTRASRCCACMLAFATKRHGSSPRRTMLRVMPRGMTARLPTCICSEHGPACTPRESELPDAARHAHPLADHAKRRMHVRSRPQLGYAPPRLPPPSPAPPSLAHSLASSTSPTSQSQGNYPSTAPLGAQSRQETSEPDRSVSRTWHASISHYVSPPVLSCPSSPIAASAAPLFPAVSSQHLQRRNWTRKVGEKLQRSSWGHSRRSPSPATRRCLRCAKLRSSERRMRRGPPWARNGRDMHLLNPHSKRTVC